MQVLIDPVAVAEKVLATPNGWSRASVFEIKALAGYCIFLEEREANPGEPVPIFTADGQHMAAWRPSDAHIQRGLRAVDEVKKSFHALESARFSARERAAQKAFDEALDVLSNHLQTEITHVER